MAKKFSVRLLAAYD